MAKKAVLAKKFANEMVGIRLSSHEKLCAERMKTLIEAIKASAKAKLIAGEALTEAEADTIVI